MSVGACVGTADAVTLRSTWPIHKRQTIQLVVAYIAMTGIWIGLGLLITGPLDGTAITRTDERIAQWFADRRTPQWNTLTLVGSTLAETWVKVLVTAVLAIVMLRMWHRWREPLVICVALIIEAASFVVITMVVGRDRPSVPHLDGSPIGSSFPSGHVAAAVAYAAIAVVVFWHTRNVLARATAVVVCVLVPIAVGLSRMYRGMHFLSDVVAGAVLGAVSVIVTVAILRPAPDSNEAGELDVRTADRGERIDRREAVVRGTGQGVHP